MSFTSSTTLWGRRWEGTGELSIENLFDVAALRTFREMILFPLLEFELSFEVPSRCVEQSEGTDMFQNSFHLLVLGIALVASQRPI